MALPNRTEYSARNAAVGPTAKALCILFGYATRIVFIRLLSTDYVGVNGLLTNVLGAFTLPMLGVDTALVYAMYGPVAQGDQARQRQLMRLYRRVYLVFALVITAAGAVFYPFLPKLIGQPVEDLGVIYILFLATTITSYLWATPGLVFLVYQRNYINELLLAAALIAQNTLQIAVLLVTRSFLLFLCLNIISNLARNLTLTLLCRREYPFLWEKTEPPLPEEEQRGIVRNIRAMLLHKAGSVIINCTDNLVLTKLFDLMAVARYANYYLIIGSAEQVVRRVIYGVTASVGNLGVTEDRAHVARIFRACMFASFCIYTIGSAALFLMLTDFIRVSFGADYVLPQTLTLVLCLNFFLNGMRNATLVFRDALGLFWYDRWKTLIQALTNLGISILLARTIGMSGVFWGTTVSIMLVPFWVEPLVLYRQYLKTPLLPYFTRFAAYLLTAAAAVGLAWVLCRWMPGGIPGLLLRLPVSLAVPWALITLIWHRCEEYRILRGIALPLLRRFLARFRGGSKEEQDNKE